jgi:hypothetical protein
MNNINLEIFNEAFNKINKKNDTEVYFEDNNLYIN